MNLKERILHGVVRLYFSSRFRFRRKYTDFDRFRKDPYILLGNHTSMIDGLVIVMPIDKYPYPVISAFMYTSPFMEFVLTKVIHSVPKRKGQSDVSTVRSIVDVIRKGRGVMIYPDGNSSYFGKESPLTYSTVKFVKKMKLDVVIGKINGGYLSMPRWADYPIRGGLYDIHVYRLIKAEDLQTMTADEIYELLVNALSFNDFDWNRIEMRKYHNKHRAQGVERYLYVCPKCGGHQTISAKGDEIFCKNCGKIAKFNDYSFLEGLPFDNLVEWDEMQKKHIPAMAEEGIKSIATVYLVDLKKRGKLKRPLGAFDVCLKDELLTFKDPKAMKESITLEVAKITGLVMTGKKDLSFDYEEKTYFMPFRDPMVFLDVINYHNQKS